MQTYQGAGGTTMALNPVAPSLTSTTAPGKAFASRAELQDHYKSDWHRYNLKRRDAGLPMLNEEDFTVRYEAAVALRKEREGREERSGVDHRKDKTKSKKSKKGQQQKKSNKRQPTFAKRNEAVAVESGEADDGSAMQEDEAADGVSNELMEEEAPEINPSQCLFDNHISSSPESNLKYMTEKYSFFLPDADYCNDLEGLLGYCNEKVRIGNVCLYCQKMFGSAEAVLGHMRDKSHCKLAYEDGVDLDEFDVFYDYERLNADSGLGTKCPNADGETMAAVVEGDEEADGEDWEDVSDEEMSESRGDDSSMDEDEDFYDGYEREVQSSGYSITPLGELVFPDGRIVGHRGLARYYKQRFAPDRSERAAVRHAREAAGDRLHCGRVVNLNRLREDAHQHRGGGQHPGALADMGRLSGSAPTGRSGGGILVPSGGRGGFTSLSLYRYRAVVRKQRKEDARGQRLQYRTRMNTNKMDKKANRLMNGVSVAHAKR